MKERKKEERMLIITMASYTLQRHLMWRTQSRLGQFIQSNRRGAHTLLRAHENNNFELTPKFDTLVWLKFKDLCA